MEPETKTLTKTSKARRRGRQCAALPFRNRSGTTMILLVTSRDTGRWVLPKGWVEPRVTASDQAAREAFEEAGIVGTISADSIGSYAYPKRLPRGASKRCKVAVYPLEVDRLERDWPEKGERVRRWFSLRTAASLVEEVELAEVMLRLGAS